MRCANERLQTKVKADCQLPENEKRQQGATGGTEQDTQFYLRHTIPEELPTVKGKSESNEGRLR